MKEPCTNNLKQHFAIMRWCCAVMMLLVASSAKATLNINQEEQLILAKAGINLSDYNEERFTVSNGHITRISLNDCGLTTLPLALLELPQVEHIELSYNQIAGNIAALVTAYRQTSPTISQKLKYLSIAHNKLTGDIGPLVELLNPLPSIEYLYADNNLISEISILPTKENFWVDVRYQELDLLIDFNADTQTPAQLMSLLPSVVHYNPWDNAYQDYHSIYLYVEGENVMDIHENGDRFSVWTRDGLRFQNGDVFNANCNDINFRLRILFTMGDVNFSGNIDDNDVETISEYIANNYEPWTFNYAAADLNNDGNVNTHDLVLLQHIVAGTTPQTTTQQGDNTITIGNLLFNSEEKYIPIGIDNANDIVAIQFDVLIPVGVWINCWNALSERVADDCRFEYNHIYDEDGIRVYRFLLYSESGGSLLSGNTGDVLTMQLNRNDDLKVRTFKWQVQNAIFTTTDSHNVYTGATLGIIDFNITPGNEEWDILLEANPMRQTDNGIQPLWDFSGGPDTAKDLEGITIEDGHITKISLNNRKLTGPFPFALTKLPYLKELLVYSNPLSGDIGEQALTFSSAEGFSPSESLKMIDLDHCEFTGNIGPMVNLYPNLETLYAQDNHITDISPLPHHQFYLHLGSQRLDSLTFDVNLATLNVETFHSQLPNVLRYNYGNNSLNNNIHIYCYRDNRNVFDLQTNDNGTFECWSGGEFLHNGELFTAQSSMGNYQLRLFFTQGDANFDGRIDVADVQRLANCISHDDYRGWSGGCNMTASDINNDSLLNVLDVVLLVNTLMAQQPPAVVPAAFPVPLAPAAWLSCDGGHLVINATQPIAAFDVIISGTHDITLTDELQNIGFTYSIQQQNNNLHIIAWSLNGATLPPGQTVIGKLHNSALSGFAAETPRIAGAVLVDSEARRLSVAIGTTTGIRDLQAEEEQADYELRMGHRHSITIWRDGRKVMRNLK